MNSTITLITPSGEHITVTPDDNSCRAKSLDGSDTLKICYSLKEPREVPIGTTTIYRGDTYTLESQSDLQMMHTELYNYTLKLTAPSGRLANYIVTNQVDGRTDFPLTATPAEHLQLIIDNLSSRESGWSIGDIVTDEVTKLIRYTNTNCKAALEQIAEEFHTELYIDGKVISIATNDQFKSDALPLRYGQGNGLLSDIKRVTDSETPISTLYIVSSDRNIDHTKYGAKTLRMPKSFTSGKFVTNSRGTSVRFKDAPKGSPEGVAELTQIYPSRVGVVSKVESPKEGLFDFLDSSIPSTLDFKEATMPGQSITIIFKTGMLAGRELEANYVHKDRRFQIVPKEEDGITLPSGVFIPKVGDKYAVFNCELPDEYVKQAERDLLNKAIELLKERNQQKVTIVAQVDSLFAKKRWGEIEHKLKVGRWVSFTAPKWNPTPTLIQIQSVTEWLTNPYSPKIELSNNPTRGGKVTELIKEVKQSEVKRREQKEALIKLQDRTYKDTEVVREMVEKLKIEGFSKALKPETLQTMYAVIGSPALQFEFVGGGFSWTEGKGGAITIPQQVIRQRVAGTTLEPEPKTVETTIPALTYTLKPDEQQAHIYVELKPTPRCVVSTKPLQITPDRLLVGLLNGTEGSRDFTPLYGFTEISPSHIATRYIRSRSGNMLIDLETGTIYSDKIEFRRPDGSTKDIDQVISEGVQVGGRNLLLKSNEGISNSDYYVGRYYISDPSMMIASETYTIQIWGEAEGADFSESLWLYNSGGNTEVTNIQNRVKGVWKQTFKWRDDQNKTNISLVIFRGANHPNYKKGSKTSITRIKLEKGTVATDWSPAPEDVQADIEAVERGYQKLIERVDVEFAISNSRDTAPTTGWQTNAPTPARGQSLWQRTKVYLKDGTTEVRGVTCIQGKDGIDGAKGNDGADGKGITKIVELYYLSSSNTVLSNGAWLETAPTPKEGYWIWTKTRIHYTTGEQLETQPICVTGNKGDRGERGLQGLQGKDGTNGLPGRDGKDGKTSYTHIAYADTATGGGFSQSPAGKAYIGMYVDFVQTDSTDPSKYAWSLIKGADGKNGLNGKDGVPGKPGADGRTPYLHIAYANSQDGKQGFSISVSEGKSYIGTYTDYTQADSTDPTKYSWSKIKGEDATQVRENLMRYSDVAKAWTWYPSVTQGRFKLKTDGGVVTLTGGDKCTDDYDAGGGRYAFSVAHNLRLDDYADPEAMFVYSAKIKLVAGEAKLIGFGNGTSIEKSFTPSEPKMTEGNPLSVYCIKKKKQQDIAIGFSLYLKTDSIVEIYDIKIERVEEGEDPRPTAYLPHPDDLKGKDVDPKLLNEIQTGLTNANTLISTLDKAQKQLEKGVLTKADIKDIQYLLDSLKNGKTQVAGGLVLTNDIILSDPNSKDVTAMISGTQTEGAKAIRLGIAKDGMETTVLNNDGTGHVGNLYFEGNRLDVREGGETLLKIGVNAIDEQVQHLDTKGRVSRSYDVAKTTIKERGEVVLTTFSTDRDGADVSLHGKLMVTYPALSRRLPVDYDFSGWEKGGGGYTLHIGYTLSIRYAGQRMCVPFAMLAVRAMASKRDGGYDVRNLKLIHQDPLNERPLHDTYVDFDEWGDIKALPHKGKYELVLGMSHREIGAKSWMGATASFVGAPTPKVVVTTKPDRNKSSISTRGARFYGDENSYFDVDYTRQSNVTAQIKGGLKVDYIDTPGVPLCGVMVDKSGTVIKSFGRYRNRSGTSQPQASYNYRTKSFTVYHSIPHDRYIPLVNPFDDPASPVISDVSAYSFKVRFTLQAERYDGWAVGFSYIAFKAE